MAIEALKHTLREQLEFHTEDVDVQHRRLCQLILELGLSSPRNSVALLRSLENLIGYFEIHASDEEEFMKKYGYPETLFHSHLDEHKDILERLRTIAASAGSDLLPDCRSIASWIQDWMDDHMATADQAYIDYFRSQSTE